MISQTVVRIDVWSDYVCPYCYLELPLLRRLQTAFGPSVHIAWRAFELRPEPHPTLDPAGEYLRSTWARSVYPMAAERSMSLKLPPVQPRSRKAFEAVAHAAAQGAFDAMHEALFKAFFEDGRDIGDTDILLDIGDSVGLETQALRLALQEQTYLPQVLQDQELAQQLGISGVPIMVLRRSTDTGWEQAEALRGAVPYQTMQSAVEHMLQNETA